jgi:hypothetical protein
MSRVFHLKFNKEADGDWYIDFPGYPFAHHNLMMVAGADLLCAYVAEKEGHPNRAVVDVTINDHLLDGRLPDIVMERIEKGYGATYQNRLPYGLAPLYTAPNGHEIEIDRAWLCPVTLLVLFQYPQKINLYIPENA